MTVDNSSTALIVGGSSGIGKAAARKLLERGTAVILLGRNPAKLADAKAELSELGSVETVRVELNDEGQTETFISLATRKRASGPNIPSGATSLPA